MKKIITILAVFTMVFCIATAVSAAKPIGVKVGGEHIKTDVAPEIIDGRTMLPVRAVFEAIGAEVDYEAETKTAIATKGDTTVTFIIDSNIMTINGVEKAIDVPAMIKDNRTLVPLRACAEAFELDVEWNNNTRTAIVRMPVSVPDVAFIAPLEVTRYYKYDSRGNEIGYDDSNGDWVNYTYDENDNLILTVESDGRWEKRTYDDNGNLVCIDYSSGTWRKYTYDENGNKTYQEDADGYWKKYTYDENGNLVYEEDVNGDWLKYTYDENGNLVYHVTSDDYWGKHTYDKNGNEIYFENSYGFWSKNTYDENGNKTYWENMNGVWEKHTYDQNGNETFCEGSSGTWFKYRLVTR